MPAEDIAPPIVGSYPQPVFIRLQTEIDLRDGERGKEAYRFSLTSFFNLERERAMTFLKRSIRVFGRRIPIAVAAFLAFTLVAVAAIILMLQNPFSGNVIELAYSLTNAYTNDDGLEDGPTDIFDNGMDPIEPYLGLDGDVARASYDIASCTAMINADYIDVTWTDTYEDTFCGIVAVIQNDSAGPIDFVGAVLVGTAPVDLTALTACGTQILPGAGGAFKLGLALNPGATGSWSGATNTIDVTYALEGTYGGCP